MFAQRAIQPPTDCNAGTSDMLTDRSVPCLSRSRSVLERNSPPQTHSDDDLSAGGWRGGSAYLDAVDGGGERSDDQSSSRSINALGGGGGSAAVFGETLVAFVSLSSYQSTVPPSASYSVPLADSPLQILCKPSLFYATSPNRPLPQACNIPVQRLLCACCSWCHPSLNPHRWSAADLDASSCEACACATESAADAHSAPRPLAPLLASLDANVAVGGNGCGAQKLGSGC